MSFLKDLGTRMIVIDEVHNLLAGSFREQRRFLNALRFMTNELEASLVCFGVNEAIDAIRGDTQLARRLDEHHLPSWEDDVEFSQLILTLIKAMELRQPSVLTLQSLRHILSVTGGVTSRIFTMIKALAIDAIETGTEKITDCVFRSIRPPKPILSGHLFRNIRPPLKWRHEAVDLGTSFSRFGHLLWLGPSSLMARLIRSDMHCGRSYPG